MLIFKINMRLNGNSQEENTKRQIINICADIQSKSKSGKDKKNSITKILWCFKKQRCVSSSSIKNWYGGKIIKGSSRESTVIKC